MPPRHVSTVAKTTLLPDDDQDIEYNYEEDGLPDEEEALTSESR